jgi:hypothetical protein
VLRRTLCRLAVSCLILLPYLASVPAADAQGVSQAMLSTVAARAGQVGTVNSIEAVQSDAGAAMVTINPHTTSVPESAWTIPVTLFVLHGSFEEVEAKVPVGDAPPKGDVLAYIVNQKDEIAAISVSNEAVDLSGPVQQFSSAQDEATIARARHKLPKPPRAHAATWGKNCKIEPAKNHCYTYADWEMKGAEEVEGAYEFQDTTAMDVPESEDGAFVDNEQWVDQYPGAKGGSWLENGQQGGDFKGCCQIWWFYAMQYPGEHYFAYVTEPVVWPTGPYNDYGIVSFGKGEWCEMYGPGLDTKYYCYGGWQSSSKELNTGAEVADEVQPSFSAWQEVAAQHMNGGWYNWNFSRTEDTTPGFLCWGQNTAPPGDIYYGTC